MAMGFNTQLWNINAVENYYGKNSWKTQMIRLRQKEDQFTRRLKPYSKRIDPDVCSLEKMELEKRFNRAQRQMTYEIKNAKKCWTPELLKNLGGKVQHNTGKRVTRETLKDTYMTYKVQHNTGKRVTRETLKDTYM